MHPRILLTLALVFTLRSTLALLPRGSSPCLSTAFTLTMKVNKIDMPLTAINSGTQGVLNLVGISAAAPSPRTDQVDDEEGGENLQDRSSSSEQRGRSAGDKANAATSDRGTPVIKSGTSPDASLLLSFSPRNQPLNTTAAGAWNVFIGDAGEVDGRHMAAIAIPQQQPSNDDSDSLPYRAFTVKDGEVVPRRTAAGQEWFACTTFVQDRWYWMLSWGLTNANGSAPAGCRYTSVRQDFNLPCGYAL